MPSWTKETFTMYVRMKFLLIPECACTYKSGVFGHIHAALFIDLCLYLVKLPCYALICTLSAVPFPASVGQ
jgi:hypothetical protein